MDGRSGDPAEETARSDREHLRADLRRLMTETGLRPTALARRAGLSPSTLTKFLNASGPGHVLSTRTLSRIARATGRRPSADPPAPGGDVGAVLADPPRPGAVDIPLLGHARAAGTACSPTTGWSKSYVPRPHALTAARDAFAVRMSSDSQEPVFRDGDLLYVNPALPPRAGDDVVIDSPTARPTSSACCAARRTRSRCASSTPPAILLRGRRRRPGPRDRRGGEGADVTRERGAGRRGRARVAPSLDAGIARGFARGRAGGGAALREDGRGARRRRPDLGSAGVGRGRNDRRREGDDDRAGFRRLRFPDPRRFAVPGDGAYEALWTEPKTTFKSLSARFARRPGGLPSDFVSRREALECAAFVERRFEAAGIERFGVRIHGAGEYPDKLRDAVHPVECLYYRGWWDLAASRSVAVVGSRKPSRAGLARARRLARDLVNDDFTVVSGLAAGIDRAAHETAIAEGGRTIAVVGTPLSHVYPRENAGLQREIAENFLLVSQVPVKRYESQDHRLNRRFFSERNATMSALTEATVIVEAGDTSGTLIQARAALAQAANCSSSTTVSATLVSSGRADSSRRAPFGSRTTMTSDSAFPRRFTRIDDSMRNRLYRADCKAVIDDLASEGVRADLIYLDPPFNSNRTYSMLFRSNGATAQQKAYHDMWDFTDSTRRLVLDSVTNWRDGISTGRSRTSFRSGSPCWSKVRPTRRSCSTTSCT